MKLCARDSEITPYLSDDLSWCRTCRDKFTVQRVGTMARLRRDPVSHGTLSRTGIGQTLADLSHNEAVRKPFASKMRSARGCGMPQDKHLQRERTCVLSRRKLLQSSMWRSRNDNFFTWLDATEFLPCSEDRGRIDKDLGAKRAYHRASEWNIDESCPICSTREFVEEDIGMLSGSK